MKTVKKETSRPLNVAILIVMCVFLCGIIAGAVTSAYIDAETARGLTQSITHGYMPENDQIRANSFKWEIIWDVYKYPFISFVLGFSLLGVALIPIAVAVRGFFISYSVGAMVQIFGLRGVILSFAISGIDLLVSVPCLILLSVQGMSASGAQLNLVSGGKRVLVGSVFPKGYFLLTILLFVLLFLLALYDMFLAPMIINLLF